MTRLIIALSALVISSSLPVFANGPMPSDNTNSGQSTGRQKWVKNRMGHLNQQNEDYRAARARAKVERELGPGGSEFASMQAQHRKEQIELLMLKNEMGVATPEERAALNRFVHKRQGHVQGQHHQRTQ
jgi:hypothetical protein